MSDKTIIDTIQRALLDADAFVLAQDSQPDPLTGNRFVDAPIRKEIGDALARIGMLHILASTLASMPHGAIYRANRYDTDDTLTVSFWSGDGKTFDLRMPKP